jgi:rhodanese-related sulfurtransferase
MNLKKLLHDSVLILALGLALGFLTHLSLIKKYFHGEYRHAFFSKEDYPSITFIGLEEAEDLFSGGEALFIDSRDKKDFRKGHILGAVNIPFVEHKEEALDLHSIPLKKTLVVYCDGSECQSSVALSKVLHKRGFAPIKVFFGGWLEWLKKGLPLEREDDSK